MSRCSVCDHLEGHPSNTNLLIPPWTKVRWRPHLNEYLCDECVQVVTDLILEDEQIDADDWELIEAKYETSEPPQKTEDVDL